MQPDYSIEKEFGHSTVARFALMRSIAPLLDVASNRFIWWTYLGVIPGVGKRIFEIN